MRSRAPAGGSSGTSATITKTYNHDRSPLFRVPDLSRRLRAIDRTQSNRQCAISFPFARKEADAGGFTEIVSVSSSTLNNKYDTIDDLDNEGSIVEWAISNKYYDAKVHFLAKTPSLPPAKPLWPPETDEEKVPAIIFVFSDGEVRLTRIHPYFRS